MPIWSDLSIESSGFYSSSCSWSVTASVNGVVASANEGSRLSDMIFFWFHNMFDKLNVFVRLKG